MLILLLQLLTLVQALPLQLAAGCDCRQHKITVVETQFPKAWFDPQEGKVPRTQVKLSGGDVLTVDSLAGVVQLNALRSFLADGFQAHLQVGV
jgi:hypothetical protein